MAGSSIGEILEGKGQLPEGAEAPKPKKEEPVKVIRTGKILYRKSSRLTQAPAPKTEPAKREEEKINPPQGNMGFVQLTTQYGLGTESLIEALPLEADKTRAYLTVPQNDKLKPLLYDLLDDKYKKVITEQEWSNSLKNHDQALEVLAVLLKQNGWQEVEALSKRIQNKGFFSRSGSPAGVDHAQFFGSIWIIPYNDQWLELPPRIYPLDLPTKIKSGHEPIPEGTVDIKAYQDDYNVQYFPHTIESGQDPGLTWIKEMADSNHFASFYERRPDLKSEGYWEESKWTGKWIFGEWVVRKTPEAIQEYLKKRFGAKLDLENRIVFAPEDQFGAIIGRSGKFEGQHIDRLQSILDRTEGRGKKLVVRKMPSKKSQPLKE